MKWTPSAELLRQVLWDIVGNRITHAFILGLILCMIVRGCVE